MKRIIFLILILCLTWASCSKVMDTKPLGSYTKEAIWTNYTLAQGFVYNCYSNDIPYIFEWNGDAITKSVSISNGQVRGEYSSEKTEQITRETNEGWTKFEEIRAVNQVISNVKTAPFSEIQKNTLIGEAHFLRACIYSFLVFHFGGVQIVKSVLTPTSNFQIPRSSLKDTYDFVLADLDTAATLLGATSDRGRANKYAAYALTMRVALQAGAYLNDNSYYRKVKTAGDLLFAAGSYVLDDYAKMFTAYATAITSPENILIFELSSVTTVFWDTPIQRLVPNSDNVATKLTATAIQKFPLKESLDGWLAYFPTQDLVDDYLTTDTDGKEKKWNQTTYFTTGNSAYKKMYQHRDLRFYASIAYDSTKYFNNWIYLRADGNVSAAVAPLNGGNINAGGSLSGYLFSKYVYQQVKLSGDIHTNYCYSVLRLGEAYLNYAEAAIRLGDEATAQTYITKTYQKHGGFTNAITATKEDLWIAYKRERHVEMILETGDRYWSLLRWGMQISGGLKPGYENTAYVIPELNGTMSNMAITSDGKSYQIFQSEDVAGKLVFTRKRYLFPVPHSKILANPTLTQNGGW